MRRARGGGRRVGRIALGIGLIAAGLIVFRYFTLFAGWIGGVVSPPAPPGSEGLSGAGFSEGYLPFAVWGFGFSLIGAGGAMIRSGFLSPGGGMMGMDSMASGGLSNPEMLGAYMQQAQAANARMSNASASQAPAKEVVRVKCRNCGSLEAEDAAFCRKCGKAL